MSNTSKGLGVKGSKFWMQAVINTQHKFKLNEMIGDDIEWLTPLADQDNYSEYELKHPYILKSTGLKDEIYSFWPNRQPQWDAIGINRDKKVIYLVEAKAHLAELNSKLSASSHDSKNLISKSMKETFDSIQSKGNFNHWLYRYYQLGNRLTFLWKLNSMKDKTGYQFKLVLLNFVDDFTHKPTTFEAWKDHYRIVLTEMLGHDNVPADVQIIDYLVDSKIVFRNPLSNQWTFIVPQVLSYGYSEDENNRLKGLVPSHLRFRECKDISDLYAFNSLYQFVNINALSDEEIKVFLELNEAFML